MTVNELVCVFPKGTTFFIHMIYADEAKTKRYWDHNHSVGWDPDFYGITRYPVGDAIVQEVKIPKLMNYKKNEDVIIFAIEKDYGLKYEELQIIKNCS